MLLSTFDRAVRDAGDRRRLGTSSTARPRRCTPVVVACALAALAASCSSSSESGSTTVHDQHDVSGSIDIGGGRRVYVDCRGVGSPTVVLISGHGVGAEDWLQVIDPADPAHEAPGDDVGAGLAKQGRRDAAVVPSVARFTRVCAYDRPWSRR